MVKVENLSEQKSYLSRLSFNSKLENSFVAKYIRNIRLVILLIITTILMGTAAYFQLPKRLNPEVKIPIITVATVVPGASPSDIEKLVTIPLEEELNGLKGLDTLSSLSRENISFITLQFFSYTDRDEAKRLVDTAVASVTNLPEEATDPQVTALDFEDQPIWIFALTSNKCLPDLMNFADHLKHKIDGLSEVDRVQTTGFDIQEIVVEINPEKLDQYNINAFELSQLIKKGRASYPAGSVNTGSNTFSVSLDRQIETIDDIRNQQLLANGRLVTLGDIATVAYKSKPNQQKTLLTKSGQEPQQAVTFYVYKTPQVNIDVAGEKVEKLITQELQDQSEFQVTTIVNTSEEIVEQFSDLLHEFQATIGLVFGCLLLFLGIRQALISSLTVPLTFLSAFVFMQFTGMSINFLSLFSFLLALGLIVDDTIVIVSAMTSYFKTGKFTPHQTGVLVWKDTIIPIWSTTITTIWSFVPLLITSGIIGEFIKPIPIVVTVTMISSTAIAVLITLPLMIVLLKPNLPNRVKVLLKFLGVFISLLLISVLLKSSVLLLPIAIVYLIWLWLTHRYWNLIRSKLVRLLEQKRTRYKLLGTAYVFWKTKARPFIITYSNKGLLDIELFGAKYKLLISKILSSPLARKRILIGSVAFAVLAFALLPLGFVKNEFFPGSDAEQLSVSVELPSGATLERTELLAREFLPQLAQIPGVEFVVAEIGKGSSEVAVLSENSNQTTFTLRLVPRQDRQLDSMQIAKNLRDQYSNFSQAKVSVFETTGGPPAGSDLQIQLLGTDLAVLDQYADKIVGYLEAENNLANVQKSIVEGTSKLSFVPNKSLVTQSGIGLDSLGFTMRLLASGFTLDSVSFREGSTDKTDITLRLQPNLASPETLGELIIPTKTGSGLPLSYLGNFEVVPNPTQISREDGQRTISISAAVTAGNIPEYNKKLETFADSMRLPSGYSWKTGGVNEENAKSIQSILQAMVLSAVLIMITMVVQFGSFRKAAIVLVVIPLAVSSVFLIFALTGTPLSFPALIGVLSLFGIVVTNSMFIVDKINLNQREGMGFYESIADAGASRLEPIILTKLCTILGLLPITIADPLWRGLGGAIISGILLASTIMLFFIPVLYYEWMKEEKKS